MCIVSDFFFEPCDFILVDAIMSGMGELHLEIYAAVSTGDTLH